MKTPEPIRNIVIVFGDQLDDRSSAFDGFDPSCDLVWMAEASDESTHVWSHKARIVMFLSAMRHFAERLRGNGIPLDYIHLDDKQNSGSLSKELAAAIQRHRPDSLVVVEPGEWRVRDMIVRTAKRAKTPLEIRPDRHFFSSVDEFNQWAEGRKELRMEFFYREMRKKHNVLMDNGKPAGGDWNYDSANRHSFSKQGPGEVPGPRSYSPDEITKQVIQLVNDRFGDHPGSLKNFDFPVTSKQAKRSLTDFIQKSLEPFGPYQDAMWMGEPYLYHSRLSAAMNLKLLDPRDAVAAAESAYRESGAPLASVEGFIRQIIGWREYVRGVYWRYMPDYIDRNALNVTRDLPAFYWTGETEMTCLRETIGQTLDYGYAHHIQRLMVTGLFSLLLGTDPKQVHEWYLAVYVDAVEWVELPNTLGMSQYADGGVMASKPYAATGKYIQRMSNYCASCRFNPASATGDDACPFTTLYWDFLQRHQSTLKQNRRMQLQLRNVERKDDSELKAIRNQAKRFADSLD